jgi:prepilin-type N-terminal cleavage/methylation domain-containing protein
VPRGKNPTRGFVLIEVLVALTILSVAGLAFVDLTAQSAQSAIRAREAEEQLGDEDRLLTAYSLLDHRDLERRIGTQAVGNYTVRVERLDWSVYRVAVMAGRSGRGLVTVIYRPGPRNDP